MCSSHCRKLLFIPFTRPEFHTNDNKRTLSLRSGDQIPLVPDRAWPEVGCALSPANHMPIRYPIALCVMLMQHEQQSVKVGFTCPITASLFFWTTTNYCVMKSVLKWCHMMPHEATKHQVCPNSRIFFFQVKTCPRRLYKVAAQIWIVYSDHLNSRRVFVSVTLRIGGKICQSFPLCPVV